MVRYGMVWYGMLSYMQGCNSKRYHILVNSGNNIFTGTLLSPYVSKQSAVVYWSGFDLFCSAVLCFVLFYSALICSVLLCIALSELLYFPQHLSAMVGHTLMYSVHSLYTTYHIWCNYWQTIDYSISTIDYRLLVRSCEIRVLLKTLMTIRFITILNDYTTGMARR